MIKQTYKTRLKIPQSGDMSHPFLYLSKSLSGDGKSLSWAVTKYRVEVGWAVTKYQVGSRCGVVS